MEFCQCLYEIENKLPRTKRCFAPCQAQKRILRERFVKNINDEIEKCKNSPYYFATTYLVINGEKYKTTTPEEQFNELFKLNNNV
jgi:hypothetical protein